jgi:hypothetical protein
MWGRGRVGGRCASRGSSSRWGGCKGGVLIAGGGGHYYRDSWAFVSQSVLIWEIGTSCGDDDEYSMEIRIGPASIVSTKCREYEMLVMERARRGDSELQSAWGRTKGSRDHGGESVRSRGPRAFFYQTRENQVQRCQYTCKSISASRPSPDTNNRAELGGTGRDIVSEGIVIWV